MTQFQDHATDIYAIYYLDTQLASLNMKQCDQLSVKSDFSCLGKKNSVQCILWVERKFRAYTTTFLIHVQHWYRIYIMYWCWRLKKSRYFRPKFWFINDYSETLRGANIILYWKEKLVSLSGWTLPKLPIISKNCTNKSYWELNFIQKSQRAHVSISCRSGVKELERLLSLKCNVLKCESRFTLGLNNAKNMHYVKKCFK